MYQRLDLEVWDGDQPIPREELLKRVPGKQGILCLITEKIDSQVLDAAGSCLKVVSTFSVGTDHIDLEAVKARGIKVGYTPGVLTDAVAELTLGLTLATARRFFQSHREILSGGWEKSAWSPLWMCGKQLHGCTVGIVGLGRIGFALLLRLKAFQVKDILYTARSPKPHGEAEGGKEVKFEELLQKSDFVICTCALTPETQGMFDKRAFQLMKPSAVFINISRGGLVNQDDLVEALKGGEIWGAGLDVMTPEPLPSHHPLLQLANCTVIPHIGSATEKTRLDMARLAAENLIAGIKGTSMPAQLL
ncbi:unnamed protein product [Darwinula stevensoni]|uniref:Glyoxylate reductase/hydroxypyruvate reductase n=1 Tax=Darwinula stevensoni TaxID=69355 RepID=A0A7R8XES0_9CRUS|nr:unnamed protein product [Darwinula stevensoni]CAG0896077.1 unnamed protein product [Darwinula stevensoni]